MLGPRSCTPFDNERANETIGERRSDAGRKALKKIIRTLCKGGEFDRSLAPFGKHGELVDLRGAPLRSLNLVRNEINRLVFHDMDPSGADLVRCRFAGSVWFCGEYGYPVRCADPRMTGERRESKSCPQSFTITLLLPSTSRSKTSAMSSARIRMHPIDSILPIELGSIVPWMP